MVFGMAECPLRLTSFQFLAQINMKALDSITKKVLKYRPSREQNSQGKEPDQKVAE